MTPKVNIAYQYVMSTGGLEAWWGRCMEVVDDLLHLHPCDGILWVDCDQGPGGWKYHAVAVLNGLVHDAWNPTVMLHPAEYVAQVFGDVPWDFFPDEVTT